MMPLLRRIPGGASPRPTSVITACLLVLSIFLLVGSSLTIASIQSDANVSIQNAQIKLDKVLSAVDTISDMLAIDDEILPHYAVSAYDATTALMRKLHLCTANQSAIDEILLWGSANEHIISSRSTYTFATFLRVYSVENVPDAEQFRQLLASVRRPTFLPIHSDKVPQLLVVRPLVIDSVPQYLMFIIPSAALTQAFTPIHDGMSGCAFVLSQQGERFIGAVTRARLSLKDIETRFTEAIFREHDSYRDHATLVLLDGMPGLVSWRRSSSSDFTYVRAVVNRWFAALVYLRGLSAVLLLVSIAWYAALAYGRKAAHAVLPEAAGTQAPDYIRMLEAQHGDVTDYIVFKLLCGNVDRVELELIREKLGLYPAPGLFVVGILAFSVSISYSEMRTLLFSFMPPTSCYTLYRVAEEHTYALLISYPAHTDEEEIIESVALLAHADNRVQRIAISGITGDMNLAPLSFTEAFITMEAFPAQEGAQRFDLGLLPHGRLIQHHADAFDTCTAADDWERIGHALADILRFTEQEALTLPEMRYLCIRVLLRLNGVNGGQPFSDACDVLLLLHYTDPLQYTSFLTGTRERCMQRARIADAEILPLVEQMKTYMQSHVRDTQFTFQRMASEYGMSLPSLSRYFHEQTGATINDHMTALKRDHAMHLLRCTSLSIVDIAQETGYFNPTSFSRRFKQITGVSPSEYRIQCQAENHSARKPNEGGTEHAESSGGGAKRMEDTRTL